MKLSISDFIILAFYFIYDCIHRIRVHDNARRNSYIPSAGLFISAQPLNGKVQRVGGIAVLYYNMFAK